MFYQCISQPIKNVSSPHTISFFTFLENVPDIGGGSQAEQQAGEQDRRGSKVKLTVLPVVHVGSGDLYEQQHRQDHVDDREHHIIDNVLDLALGSSPGTGTFN